MFYVIRTLIPTGARLLVSDVNAQDEDGKWLRGVYGFATREAAEKRAECVPGCATVKEFASDAEARMYLDPACVSFRTAYDSRLVA
jgi:hypothetical protein